MTGKVVGHFCFVAALFLLCACSSQSQEGTSTSVSAVATEVGENLDGSYTATESGESMVLTIAGTTGVLTRQDADGNRHSQQVTVTTKSHSMVIGDASVSYTFEEEVLLLTEKEPSDLFKGGVLSFYPD